MTKHPITSRPAVGRLLTAGVCLLVMLGITACGSTTSTTSASSSAGATSAITIKIGTLQTDDILPLWAAVQDGSAKAAGLDLQIQTFMSAQDEVTAVTAKQVDAIMTDMVVPVQLTASGTAMRSVTRLQGSPAGIVAAPGAGIAQVSDLAGVAAGCSSPTAMEYIYDKALSDAGVKPDQIKTQEIKNLSVRLQMVTGGQIKAAVLPWTLFAMAQKQGAVPLLDSTQASNYSSTVLAFRAEWLSSNAQANDAITKLLALQNAEVAKINANPDSYRSLLAQQAKLPAPLATSYKVRTYPTAGLPDQKQFESVVAWMVSKGYIKAPIPYSDLVWSPTA